ncbi:Glutathione reductase, mitochondrial, partial [Parelaphostrongylus tenuis]
GPVTIHKNTKISSIEKRSDGLLTIKTNNGIIDEVNTLIWLLEEHHLTSKLNLEKVGVKTDDKGHIIVDQYQCTSNPSILCIGDAAGKFLLTPVAIAAGRRLAPPSFQRRVFKLSSI